MAKSSNLEKSKIKTDHGRIRKKIPATMVSQHPDHSHIPYWHNQAFITTADETKELYLSFSDLGVSEYKWDWEGKLVDESVMERLLSEYFEYFKKNPLGVEKYLTFRLPNPSVETEFRLGRAFMNLISAAAMAHTFKLPDTPLFEVILPMTTSSDQIISIHEAFNEIAGLKHSLYRMDQIPLKSIKVIPLFEEIDTIANSDAILEEYLEVFKQKFERLPLYIRPYMARSDPALNSGMVPTVLSIKIALSKYKNLEKKYKLPFYPIIGSASLPFRGGLRPDTVDSFTNEYRGVRTALLQSAFRYDFPKKEVIKAINKLESLLPRGVAEDVNAEEEKILKELMVLFESFYKGTVEGIADTINELAQNLPKRRERVQHIGLFGYSRGVGKVKLPRAIGFTAALYSIGVPPELIGMGRGLAAIKGQTDKLGVLEKFYLNINSDLCRAGGYLNKKNLKMLAQGNKFWKMVQSDVEGIEDYIGQKLEPRTPEELEHQKITSKIYAKMQKKENLKDLIEKAAILRKSLG